MVDKRLRFFLHGRLSRGGWGHLMITVGLLRKDTHFFSVGEPLRPGYFPTSPQSLQPDKYDILWIYEIIRSRLNRLPPPPYLKIHTEHISWFRTKCFSFFTIYRVATAVFRKYRTCTVHSPQKIPYKTI